MTETKLKQTEYDIATTSDVETGTNDTKPVTSRGVRDAMATDGEASAGTDEAHYVNPKQLHNNIKDSLAASVSKSAGTNYQAATAGFVVANAVGGSDNDISLIGYVGASNPAGTIISANATSGSSMVSGSRFSISFPVLKNQWYRVDFSSPGFTPGSCTIVFIPMQ